MKKFLTIVMTVIILVAAITSSTVTFAASMPTTTITSIKAQNKAFTVKWKKKSSITGYQIQYSINSKFKKENKSIKINHSIKCGNMGKWFNSRDEVDDYWVQIDNNYAKQYLNGTITFEEYCKKSPYGYESWSCSYCGKWTGNFKYD